MPVDREAPRPARRAGVKGLALLLSLISTSALAESGWLTTRGRLQPELAIGAWGGTNSFGLGFVLPDKEGARAAWATETGYGFRARTLEFRGARLWQLTEGRFATPSLVLGASVHVVPEGRFDVGLGPHVGLNLALGGPVFSVDLGLQTGAELFFNPLLSRLPQRALLGLNLRLGDFALGLHAKVGIDLVPGASFVGRGELVATLGYFGLEAARKREPVQ